MEHNLIGTLLLPASVAVRVEHQTIHAQTITVALTSTQASSSVRQAERCR
jgi:hypothetical protein